MKVVFEVEQAGCESCGRLIGGTLGELGAIESLEIDEGADLATVVLSGGATRKAVDAALRRASAGAGHEYRVRDGSWRDLH